MSVNSVYFEVLENRLLLSADLAPIQGGIDRPGEVDAYTFTLTETRDVYFDVTAPDAALRWSLDGPGGALVTDRRFDASDAAQIGAPVARLEPGQYSIRIDAEGDATPDYGFRLVDVDAGGAITPGEPVARDAEDGRVAAVYGFDGTAGERVSLEVAPGTGPTAVATLIAPDTKRLAVWQLDDRDTTRSPCRRMAATA